jgi:hypothetical protein
MALPRLQDGNHLEYLGCAAATPQFPASLLFGNDFAPFGFGAGSHWAPAFAVAVTKGRRYMGVARTNYYLG